MAKELNEDTAFKLSIKTIIGAGFAIATLAGMWFTLQADIAEAKETSLEKAKRGLGLTKEQLAKERKKQKKAVKKYEANRKRKNIPKSERPFWWQRL